MKKIAIYILIITCFVGASNIDAQSKIVDLKKELKDNFNFILGTDLGRNGRYQQKEIAELMGETASEMGAEFVIASGDTHHYLGVESVNDPLWLTNFEHIYSHPELQIEWYPILGNHEYRGNTQAVIDYSKVSRRWTMPSRYYTKSFKLDNGESVRIVFIDTPPLIDKYRKNRDEYPDACKQNMDQQLAWLEQTLKNATEKWKIVVGHHPIYADTSKGEDERNDMQKRVDPILQKHNVDMYICGHIHNFQHIKAKGSTTNYIVNSSGSLSRKVKPIEGTLFCSPLAGFSFISISNNNLSLYMIDSEGNVLYSIKQ